MNATLYQHLFPKEIEQLKTSPDRASLLTDARRTALDAIRCHNFGADREAALRTPIQFADQFAAQPDDESRLGYALFTRKLYGGAR